MKTATLWFFFFAPAAAASVTGSGASTIAALASDGVGHAPDASISQVPADGASGAWGYTGGFLVPTGFGLPRPQRAATAAPARGEGASTMARMDSDGQGRMTAGHEDDEELLQLCAA